MIASLIRKTVKAKLENSLIGLLVAACAFFAFVRQGAHAQSPPSQTGASAAAAGQEPGRLFIIGHLRGDPESPLDATVFDRLRDFLLGLPAIRTAMAQEGVSGIEVQSADSVNILIDWMNQEQVDLAFAPAVAFTRQTGDYDAVFQLRRPRRDIIDPRGDRVVHRGVIFVNNRSRLFRAPRPGPELTDYLRRELPSYLATHPVAFVSSFSAAGYFYPHLRLADLTSNTQPQSYFFCGSPEEVVKSVINGVAEIGACDEGVIEEVLGSGPEGLLDAKDRLVRVILETSTIPTDPVALRARWHPRAGSVLGAEIRNGLRAFFERHPEFPRLVSSSRERFDELQESLERFHELGRERELRTTGPPAAPSRTE